jgi:argininosuccinate lyase
VIDLSEKALWSGRFEGDMDDSTLRFTSSLDVDSALAFYDIMGSLAHVRMLKKCGIIPAEDADLIIDGLKKIEKTLEDGELELDENLEDIHTNIEFKLTSMIGPAGGKLHTGRSRNDQVATDFRMYLRDAAMEAVDKVDDLIMALLRVAEDNAETIMPGFTHMQHAQPITLAQHFLAHAFRLGRDADRFVDAVDRMNKCPLGSAALAGTTYPIDRKMTADALGFKEPTENSIDSVASRDNVSELAFCAAMTAVDMSSICEELVLWSSQEFGFIEMDDKYTTGSSIMPQKKNPDIAELIRGRTGSIIGGLVAMLTMSKGLPLSYNRDLQEDKGAVMDALDSVTFSAEMLAKVILTTDYHKDRMLEVTQKGFINATDLADYLVTKGVPFREAHGIVGESVRYCIENGKGLEDLSQDEFRQFSPKIEDDVYEFLPVKACVERRNSYGGTSSASVDTQLSLAIKQLMARDDSVREETQFIEKCWEELLN